MRNVFLLACVLAAVFVKAGPSYEPTSEQLQARREFAEKRFGIFIHWGVYAMFAQGEWYLGEPLDPREYEQAMHGFYPSRFDAKAWAKAFREAGAKYVTFTSRHHDGFSMFASRHAGGYDILHTPFKRDVARELADAVRGEGLQMNFYYSLLDWHHPAYPVGSCPGPRCFEQNRKEDYRVYKKFMMDQIAELLTNYGEIGCIWFDGEWEHGRDGKFRMDWELPDIYRHIHSLQPKTLVCNNHHHEIIDGEDIQTFEQDAPGENTAGLSANQRPETVYPLETCKTLSGMWGYKIQDRKYMSVAEAVRLLALCASRNANLLLNVSPRADGTLPEAALERLKGIGDWLRANGESIYGTTSGPSPIGKSVVTTVKGNRTFVHFLDPEANVYAWRPSREVVSVRALSDGSAVPNERTDEGTLVLRPSIPAGCPDYVVEVTLR